MKNNIMESGVRVYFTISDGYELGSNPYIALMKDAITLSGNRIYAGGAVRALFLCSVFHFNWDVFLLGKRWQRPYRFFKKIMYVLCIKLLGEKSRIHSS